jgi:preprotein translocase subunit YajC
VNLFPFIWMALMFGAFYLLLVRPQRRQLAAHQELMGSLVAGDEVMTMGGILGRISHLGKEVVNLGVSPGTSLPIVRSAILRKVEV